MIATVHELPVAGPVGIKVPIGRTSSGPLELDLEKLMTGRCLAQGSSGAGKSHLIRKIVEEAFDYVTVMLVDPEGEFGNLAEHIGATTLKAVDFATEGLTAAASRARRHRLPLHLDLTDLDPEERIQKASAFFAGLIGCPPADWKNTVLVAIDEGHLLAPHLAGSARDAEVRRLGVAALTDLCARGRKRGIGTLIATQRLAKLAGSVISELHNVLIGLNVFDRDVARAADLLGFGREDAQRLRNLAPGDFYAFGPALTRVPLLAHIDESITKHMGEAPELVSSADCNQAEARILLELDGLEAMEAGHGRIATSGRPSRRALEEFLLDPRAAVAAAVVQALAKISPNATTSEQLAGHVGSEKPAVDAALDLLGNIGAIDTMPRGETRIARLSGRMRLRAVPANVVGL